MRAIAAAVVWGLVPSGRLQWMIGPIAALLCNLQGQEAGTTPITHSSELPMRIGQLAGQAGVTPDTIRYYERQGLLSPTRRTHSRYREYDPEALEDLLFIKKAQALGLRLRDIREVMEIAAGGEPPCEHVRATVMERLTEVEERLRELRGLRATLRATLERLDRAPTAEAGCRCAAIESG